MMQMVSLLIMETSLIEKMVGKDRAAELTFNPDRQDSFCLHDRQGELKELFSKQYFKGVLSPLEWWQGGVDIHLPETRDEASSITVSTREAKDYFAQGHSVLINDIENFDQSLAPGIREVIQSLSLPSLTYGRHLIYLTPAGGGTAPHFDQNINIVVQIHGKKTWWVAPNESVHLPLTRHTLGTDCDGELATYVDGSFPEEMPQNTTEYVLKPGSVLFVPRGAWHCTQAETDAAALNLTLSTPSYADVYLATLRSYLVRDPSWRKSVQWNLKESETHFDELIEGLGQKIHMLGTEDVKNACEGME